MPNQSPISRYLLLGIAALMFVASLPDAELLLQQARRWRNARQTGNIERVTMTDPMPFR